MPADDRLILLLRSLQTYSDQQDTTRLLSTSSYLLATLSNHLNLTVVTTQLLSAPAIWTHPDGLKTCLQFMGVFQSATLMIVRHELESTSTKHTYHNAPSLPQPLIGGNLSRDVWVKSVVNGADDRSQGWKHLLVIGGLILGYSDGEPQQLSRRLRSMLVDTFVKKLNLALADVREGDELAASCVTLVLNNIFPILTDVDRSGINYDMMLPVLLRTAFFSQEGYRSGYFMANVDADVVQVSPEKFGWSDQSISFKHLTAISSQSLITGMGPLSRLIAHTVENCRESWLVQAVIDDLSELAQTLMSQWRQIKLCEVDVSEEKLFFEEKTLNITVPTLWKLLRSCLFAVIIVLRSCLIRVVSDSTLADYQVAPVLAVQTLLTLRHFCFITNRLGPNSFSQNTFVYLTAIDILSQYPAHSETFLRGIAPPSLGRIASHPLDRALDLYFLNTAEHFSLVLPPVMSDELLIAKALPYLNSGADARLLDMFEAAHSVMLSVLSSPRCVELAVMHLPRYVEALFSAFPQNLSSRQFRMAFKTLLRITTPPSPLSVSFPDFPEVLLELVRDRAAASVAHPTTSIVESGTQNTEGDTNDEATTMVLTLIDSLSLLPPDLLEEYLPIAAQAVTLLHTPESRQQCTKRFWEALSSGEMDMDRSHLCLAWWTTRGGRDMVLLANEQGANQNRQFFMSGALQSGSESKL